MHVFVVFAAGVFFKYIFGKQNTVHIKHHFINTLGSSFVVVGHCCLIGGHFNEGLHFEKKPQIGQNKFAPWVIKCLRFIL